MTPDEAYKLLLAGGVFFDSDEEAEPEIRRCINMNDAWYWACADGETVPDDSIVEVAELFSRYGDCGIHYWVWKRRGKPQIEFRDVRRHIEFVEHEEALRAAEPSSSKRAYAKHEYMIGGMR